MNNEKNDPYIAHADAKTQRTQSVRTHNMNVAHLMVKNCPLEILKNIAWVCGVMHDCGKYGSDFVDYMEDILKRGELALRRHIDHSTAGGRLVRQLAEADPRDKYQLAAKLISTAIYSHHGLMDCIDLDSGRSLEELRGKKDIQYSDIVDRYFKYHDRHVLDDYLGKANEDAVQLRKDIMGKIKKDATSPYGVKNFYLGMFERLLLSLLIDSDWSDTASFMNDTKLPERLSADAVQAIWNQAIEHFEKHMEGLARSAKKKSPLNNYRQEISDACHTAALTDDRLYGLTVPTGAGKTLSSLRFALYHARKYHKQHIIYIAPYNSILEQNAAEIRSAVGDGSMVLEHHCNIINEDADVEEKYRYLTETWDSPIIVTTAVQILNTLFSGAHRDIRRLYSLCNSVIIFDEVQAFPVRCTELFNLAVNFLEAFCNTTVVLCSATQPSLAKLPKNRVFEWREMSGDVQKYAEAFWRVTIEDKTQMTGKGMEVPDLVDFVGQVFPNEQSILIIVNTKKCASDVYRALETAFGDSCELYHLSTNMCPQNRKDALEEIKAALDEQKKVICVSTQLVEAGVDFSFSCVIRSLAGLDSIIQAAGRCNRHKRGDTLGHVYIVKMSPDAERLSGLREIRMAQDAMKEVLYQYSLSPERFDNRRDSEKAIKYYYELFFRMADETNYPFGGYGAGANLVDLLSNNRLGCGQFSRVHGNGMALDRMLNQSFKKAGELFQVIPDDEKIQVVVEYDQNSRDLIQSINRPYVDAATRKRCLRQLQLYTVGISETLRNQLSNAINRICEDKILVLAGAYYDSKIGVTESPKMDLLNY